MSNLTETKTQLKAHVDAEVRLKSEFGATHDASAWRAAMVQLHPALQCWLAKVTTEVTARDPTLSASAATQLLQTATHLFELLTDYNAGLHATDAELARVGRAAFEYSPKAKSAAAAGAAVITRTRTMVGTATDGREVEARPIRVGLGIGETLRRSPPEVQRFLEAHQSVLQHAPYAKLLGARGVPVELLVEQTGKALGELSVAMTAPDAFTASETRARRDETVLAMEVVAGRLLVVLYALGGAGLYEEVNALMPVSKRAKKKGEEDGKPAEDAKDGNGTDEKKPAADGEQPSQPLSAEGKPADKKGEDIAGVPSPAVISATGNGAAGHGASGNGIGHV